MPVYFTENDNNYLSPDAHIFNIGKKIVKSTVVIKM